MFLVLAFMYTVCMTIKGLVLEKELRLKEVLRAVGIQNIALWSARFTENIVLLTIPCGLISILVKVSRNKSCSGKYQNTKHQQVNMNLANDYISHTGCRAVLKVNILEITLFFPPSMTILYVFWIFVTSLT